MKLSYGITVYNEAEELFRLTDLLINNIDKEDEIVICVDGNDEKVKLVLENLQKTYQWNSNIIIYNRKLDKDSLIKFDNPNFSTGSNFILILSPLLKDEPSICIESKLSLP